MQRKAVEELRKAFDADVKAIGQKKLAIGSKVPTKIRERRAANYRRQMEIYITELEAKGVDSEIIQAHIKAARKMYRSFLGVK